MKKGFFNNSRENKVKKQKKSGLSVQTLHPPHHRHPHNIFNAFVEDTVGGRIGQILGKAVENYLILKIEKQ